MASPIITKLSPAVNVNSIHLCLALVKLRFQGWGLLTQGLECTTLFCGDGINDIAALAAADVGLAVGATDAVIGASLSTSRGSVEGKNCCLPAMPVSSEMDHGRDCK